jgi:signal transduction histidine kinase/ActR/RegA family two-component response regulator
MTVDASPASARPEPPRGPDVPSPEGGQDSPVRQLQRVAVALSAERDHDRLLGLIVTKCREVTAADAGSLYLVQPDPAGRREADSSLRFVVAQNDSRRLDLPTVTLPLNRGSIAGYVALTRRPLNLADAYALPPGAEFQFNPRMDQAFDYRTVSMLVVPMLDHTGEVIGVVQVINKKPSAAVVLDSPETAVELARPFGPRDEELVTALASLAAVAIQGRRAEEARTRLEDQLRQSQKMEAVGRLAGGVAHDFNNLLTVIRGRSDLLLHHVKEGEPLRRHIALIRETAERAVGLTQQLLTFSRKGVVRPQVLDLNVAVTGMAKMLRRLIGEHIELEVRPGEGLWRVQADPSQVEQVVMNLAVNARDAMPRGGRLTVETANATLDDAFARAHTGSRPGAYVRLAVGDTGVGMDAATRAHLFEPFFTTKAPGQGTGLGLATVYGIVKQHRGYVTADSEPGRGSRFTIYLPRSEAPIAAPAPLAPASPPAGGSETVLLVEDEESVRELVQEILKARGYTVIEARHGAEALVVADQHPGVIHLLLTDVVMPQMGGRELVRRLRQSRPDVRVLYMSGYLADATPPEGIEIGIPILAKPFTADALAATMREALNDPAPASGPVRACPR